MDIKALVVDDEQLARDELCYLLEQAGGVTVVAQAANGVDALALIAEHAPDLVFLDVQMPGLNGFEVARQVLERQEAGADDRPDAGAAGEDTGGGAEIVFVTAFDQYAIDAFQVDAVDYLLKPVDPDRLDRALGRVERLRSRVESPPDLQGLLRTLADSLARSQPQYPERIASRLGERLWFIDLDRVTHFHAEDKLTFAVEGGKPYCVDHTIVELEALLDPRRFIRIHRGTIVNASWIKEVATLPGGSLNLRLKDATGTDLTVSRDRARAFKTRLLGR